MPKEQIKVLIADDHDLIRQGIKRILEFEDHIQVIGEACNGEEVMQMLNIYRPDVLLLDFNMPPLDGLELLKDVKSANETVKTIILTVENDKNIIEKAIELGADGYVLKESAGTDVVDAIDRVFANDKHIDKSLVSVLFSNIKGKSEKDFNVFECLTDREIEVMYYISQGYSNKAIGEALFLSEKTIKNYATKLFRKLSVKDRANAIIFAKDNDFDEFYKMKSKAK